MQAATEYLQAVREGDNAKARITLRALSVVTGGFLILAGCAGLSWITHSFVFFVGSLYAITFGLLVLVVEINERVAVTAKVYRWIDTYLKFLTLQRGKGAFYCGVGLLVFFIGTGDGGWALNHVAAFLLAAVGVLHTFKVIKEAPPADIANAFPPVEAPTAAASTWGQMRAQADEDALRT